MSEKFIKTGSKIKTSEITKKLLEALEIEYDGIWYSDEDNGEIDEMCHINDINLDKKIEKIVKELQQLLNYMTNRQKKKFKKIIEKISLN